MEIHYLMMVTLMLLVESILVQANPVNNNTNNDDHERLIGARYNDRNAPTLTCFTCNSRNVPVSCATNLNNYRKSSNCKEETQFCLVAWLFEGQKTGSRERTLTIQQCDTGSLHLTPLVAEDADQTSALYNQSTSISCLQSGWHSSSENMQGYSYIKYFCCNSSFCNGIKETMSKDSNSELSETTPGLQSSQYSILQSTSPFPSLDFSTGNRKETTSSIRKLATHPFLRAIGFPLRTAKYESVSEVSGSGAYLSTPGNEISEEFGNDFGVTVPAIHEITLSPTTVHETQSSRLMLDKAANKTLKGISGTTAFETIDVEESRYTTSPSGTKVWDTQTFFTVNPKWKKSRSTSVNHGAQQHQDLAFLDDIAKSSTKNEPESITTGKKLLMSGKAVLMPQVVDLESGDGSASGYEPFFKPGYQDVKPTLSSSDKQIQTADYNNLNFLLMERFHSNPSLRLLTTQKGTLLATATRQAEIVEISNTLRIHSESDSSGILPSELWHYSGSGEDAETATQDLDRERELNSGAGVYHSGGSGLLLSTEKAATHTSHVVTATPIIENSSSRAFNFVEEGSSDTLQSDGHFSTVSVDFKFPADNAASSAWMKETTTTQHVQYQDFNKTFSTDTTSHKNTYIETAATNDINENSVTNTNPTRSSAQTSAGKPFQLGLMNSTEFIVSTTLSQPDILASSKKPLATKAHVSDAEGGNNREFSEVNLSSLTTVDPPISTFEIVDITSEDRLLAPVSNTSQSYAEYSTASRSRESQATSDTTMQNPREVPGRTTRYEIPTGLHSNETAIPTQQIEKSPSTDKPDPVHTTNAPTSTTNQNFYRTEAANPNSLLEVLLLVNTSVNIRSPSLIEIVEINLAKTYQLALMKQKQLQHKRGIRHLLQSESMYKAEVTSIERKSNFAAEVKFSIYENEEPLKSNAVESTMRKLSTQEMSEVLGFSVLSHATAVSSPLPRIYFKEMLATTIVMAVFILAVMIKFCIQLKCKPTLFRRSNKISAKTERLESGSRSPSPPNSTKGVCGTDKSASCASVTGLSTTAESLKSAAPLPAENPLTPSRITSVSRKLQTDNIVVETKPITANVCTQTSYPKKKELSKFVQVSMTQEQKQQVSATSDQTDESLTEMQKNPLSFLPSLPLKNQPLMLQPVCHLNVPYENSTPTNASILSDSAIPNMQSDFSTESISKRMQKVEKAEYTAELGKCVPLNKEESRVATRSEQYVSQTLSSCAPSTTPSNLSTVLQHSDRADRSSAAEGSQSHKTKSKKRRKERKLKKKEENERARKKLEDAQAQLDILIGAREPAVFSQVYQQYQSSKRLRWRNLPAEAAANHHSGSSAAGTTSLRKTANMVGEIEKQVPAVQNYS